MRRFFLVLLSCSMVFFLVVTVSASSGGGSGDARKEVFIDLTSHTEKINKANNEGNSEIIEDDIEYTTDTENTGRKDNAASVDDDAEDQISEDGDEIGEGAANDNGKAVNSDEIEDASVNLKFVLGSQDVSEKLLLVNKESTLGSKYIPRGLISVAPKAPKVSIPPKKAGIFLQNEALSNLNNMYAAACKSGITDMVLSSGYRSYSEQNLLYKRKVGTLSRGIDRKQAEQKASTIVAPPGSSEHQTGLAVDITTRQLLKGQDPLIPEFANTACGKWMSANSWKFGYILRYEANKVKVTNIIYEPWHFRYVGKLHAEIMHKNKICLEEYVSLLKSKSRISYTDTSKNEYEIVYILPPEGAEILNIAVDKGAVADISKLDKSGYVLTLKKPQSAAEK